MNGELNTNRTWFFIFVFSFTLGIFFRSFFNLGAEFLFFLIFLAIALLPAYFIYKTRAVFLVSLFIFGTILGILRFDISEINRNDPLLEMQTGKTALVEGIILNEPDERDDAVILVLKGEKIYDGDNYMKIKGKIRLATGRYPPFKYGDRVIARGKIVHPKSFENEETKKIFDYPGYLASQHIYYEMKYPKNSIIDSDNGNFIINNIMTFWYYIFF